MQIVEKLMPIKPFGWNDLKPTVELRPTSLDCPVKGCEQVVPRQRGKFTRAFEFQCPDHGIFISPSTFEYPNETDNMLWTAPEDLELWRRIKLPGVKRESRVARDNSEDALTWNVFRYLEREALLGKFLDDVSAEAIAKSPRIIYWSYCQTKRHAWPALLEVVQLFGEKVPRRSEPDLIVEDENVLAFIENKLTAGNSTTPSEPNNCKSYPTGCDSWWNEVFQKGSDFQSVAVRHELYELMRLWLIGSRLAASQGKRFLLINIVRCEAEQLADMTNRFGKHIREDKSRAYIPYTWEQLLQNIVVKRSDASSMRLMAYARGKTIGYAQNVRMGKEIGSLRRAFSVLSDGRQIDQF